MTSAPPIVLASTSIHRRELLRRIGLPHVVERPLVDEVDDGTRSSAACAAWFAECKARSIAHLHGGALVIGSDQTLELDGETLRKPSDRVELLAQLARLSGRRHALHTGLFVLDTRSGRAATETCTVELTMRSLTASTLERYVDLDRPFGCVGGYTFEQRGVCLFSKVEGADDSAIVGLPIMSLVRGFESLGHQLIEWLERSGQSP